MRILCSSSGVTGPEGRFKRCYQDFRRELLYLQQCLCFATMKAAGSGGEWKQSTAHTVLHRHSRGGIVSPKVLILRKWGSVSLNSFLTAEYCRTILVSVKNKLNAFEYENDVYCILWCSK